MSESSSIWGGRFEDKPADIMEQINASIGVDKRFWRQDILASKAHCTMLMRQSIIPEEDGQKILDGLAQIEQEIAEGRFEFKIEFEDVHMNVEARLKELIGDAAGRLHTARSRNDQVATDFRLWVRDACATLEASIQNFQRTLESLADQHEKTVMPGFTHLQIAQPITLAMHFLAYRDMLERDKGRIIDCRGRVNECPLGAAALAGTPFPVDREFTARELGFQRPMPNTMDAVSARDFANEFLFACAQTGLHLSRLAEEVILWSTPQFGFLRLSDAWSTGSSIMPQKKNPDAAELVRGKTGRLTGNLVQMMTVLKGLPLAYNKDLQEDKEPVFDSFDTLCLCLDAMNGMIDSAQWNDRRMREAAEEGYATATRLADWLVMELGLPFREAHHITGQIVKMAENKGVRLDELSLEEMRNVKAEIDERVYGVLKL
ncbi:MAG: argininosuccinate lyase [Alphaproteobacteria bacterium]|nr:argininosuccinate lyase [Alphaproteobacteria bacterium]